jgi:hypothetical protein
MPMSVAPRMSVDATSSIAGTEFVMTVRRRPAANRVRSAK